VSARANQYTIEMFEITFTIKINVPPRPWRKCRLRWFDVAQIVIHPGAQVHQHREGANAMVKAYKIKVGTDESVFFKVYDPAPRWWYYFNHDLNFVCSIENGRTIPYCYADPYPDNPYTYVCVDNFDPEAVQTACEQINALRTPQWLSWRIMGFLVTI
jgi:hypothetical protein